MILEKTQNLVLPQSWKQSVVVVFDQLYKALLVGSELEKIAFDR
jgi:hypothetical protein